MLGKLVCLALAVGLPAGLIATPAGGGGMQDFRITHVMGAPLGVDARLSLEGTRIAVQSPCNSLAMGFVRAPDGSLVEDLPLIATQAICADPALAAAEARLRQALSGVSRLSQEGERLVLSTADGAIRIEAERQDAAGPAGPGGQDAGSIPK
ncbi:META domain-containing protein [Microvirga tunisiensis]|uniref:META domain-containing protein n=1 Tax=Pannonibacter tanglangensis TaxID=2750084 RepID=A0A7X5J8S1_9HYPH|nr:META domain-containing protein [Pannonibacter sp. XCT-53]NBN77761.1 META domain-containing protein [Pannonibacter sp. XCT-53]